MIHRNEVGGEILRFIKFLVFLLMWFAIVQMWSSILDKSEITSPIHEYVLKQSDLQAPSTNSDEKEMLPNSDPTVQPIEEMLFIGMTEDELLSTMGEPSRKEPSAYGYEWWIYNKDLKKYIQIGIEEGKVTTFYTNAPSLSWKGFHPTMTYEKWSPHWVEQREWEFLYNLGSYTFALSDQDMRERPIMIEKDQAIQLYLDVHQGRRISGIRVMDLKTLLLHRPYSVRYIGDLPEVPELSEEEWIEIEKSYERQVFDVVNVSRSIFNLPLLTWHEEVAKVAKGHSKDMQLHQFFDHVSPMTGELSDRLEAGKVHFKSAGENIAWNYIDGPDAHEGWMNSTGHRKNVMKEKFNYLGVGVIKRYYTQNFLYY